MAKQQRKVNDFYYNDTPQVLLELGIECDKYAEKTSSIEVNITPNQAKRILEQLNNHNRAIKERDVKNKKQEMLKGTFDLSTSIRFDVDGNLMDGQHRLMALSQLDGKIDSVRFFAVYNDQMANQKYLDIGVKRSHRDILALDGLHPDIYTILRYALRGQYLVLYNKRDRARACCPCEPAESLSLSFLDELYQKHKEAIDFANEEWDKYPLCGGGSRTCYIRSVIVRAYYHENHKSLSDFIRLYKTKEASDPKEQNKLIFVLRFKDKLTGWLKSSGHEATLTTYWITEKAIQEFCQLTPEDETPKMLWRFNRDSAREIYPVPGFDRATPDNEPKGLNEIKSTEKKKRTVR